MDLEHWNNHGCEGSRCWLQCDILAEDTALLLLLKVPIHDSHELEGMLLTAWNWKDACLEVDKASWLLLHTSAAALLESAAASLEVELRLEMEVEVEKHLVPIESLESSLPSLLV